jgi:hypothetical protein
MKPLLKHFMATILLLNCLALAAQRRIPIVIFVGHPSRPQLKEHAGLAVLKDRSDTLRGIITMGKTKKGKDGIILKKQGSIAKFIANEQLSAIRLYDYDSLIVSTKYTDYCLSPLNDWTKMENHFRTIKFKK